MRRVLVFISYRDATLSEILHQPCKADFTIILSLSGKWNMCRYTLLDLEPDSYERYCKVLLDVPAHTPGVT